MEEWRPINEFLGYSVSDEGRVLNTRTGRIMVLSENQKSLVIVGLMQKGIQQKRAVSHLVAKAYLPPPQFDTFDSVINMDGDRRNNYAINLAWRPRWFALKYHAQFAFRQDGARHSIADMETGVEYASVWDAAVSHGLLVYDIVESIDNQTHVWPTRQRFWRLQE